MSTPSAVLGGGRRGEGGGGEMEQLGKGITHLSGPGELSVNTKWSHRVTWLELTPRHSHLREWGTERPMHLNTAVS